MLCCGYASLAFGPIAWDVADLFKLELTSCLKQGHDESHSLVGDKSQGTWICALTFPPCMADLHPRKLQRADMLKCQSSQSTCNTRMWAAQLEHVLLCAMCGSNPFLRTFPTSQPWERVRTPDSGPVVLLLDPPSVNLALK